MDTTQNDVEKANQLGLNDGRVRALQNSQCESDKQTVTKIIKEEMRALKVERARTCINPLSDNNLGQFKRPSYQYVLASKCMLYMSPCYFEPQCLENLILTCMLVKRLKKPKTENQKSDRQCHRAFHIVCKQRNCKSCISVRWTIDHALCDQRLPKWRNLIDFFFHSCCNVT